MALRWVTDRHCEAVRGGACGADAARVLQRSSNTARPLSFRRPGAAAPQRAPASRDPGGCRRRVGTQWRAARSLRAGRRFDVALTRAQASDRDRAQQARKAST